MLKKKQKTNLKKIHSLLEILKEKIYVIKFSVFVYNDEFFPSEYKEYEKVLKYLKEKMDLYLEGKNLSGYQIFQADSFAPIKVESKDKILVFLYYSHYKQVFYFTNIAKSDFEQLTSVAAGEIANTFFELTNQKVTPFIAFLDAFDMVEKEITNVQSVIEKILEK